MGKGRKKKVWRMCNGGEGGKRKEREGGRGGRRHLDKENKKKRLGNYVHTLSKPP